MRIRTTALFEEGENVLDDNLTPVPSNPQSDENVPLEKQKRFVQRNPTRVSGKFKVDETREVQKKRAIALDGLDRLRAFSRLDGKSSEWEVRLKGPSTEESR